VAEAREQVVADGRVRVEDGVVGIGQAVVGDLPCATRSIAAIAACWTPSGIRATTESVRWSVAP
jgi:hypothetical protein